jgi:hypothetical protein
VEKIHASSNITIKKEHLFAAIGMLKKSLCVNCMSLKILMKICCWSEPVLKVKIYSGVPISQKNCYVQRWALALFSCFRTHEHVVKKSAKKKEREEKRAWRKKSAKKKEREEKEREEKRAQRKKSAKKKECKMVYFMTMYTKLGHVTLFFKTLPFILLASSKFSTVPNVTLTYIRGWMQMVYRHMIYSPETKKLVWQ